MFKLDLEKAEEQEMKLPTSIGSSKKQKNFRKTSTSALLIMPKPLDVLITTHCGKFLKRWEYQTKYPYVVHAELNAILNANGRDLRGSRIYVALFPCNECAKAIIQSGIREVCYLSDKYADTMMNLVSKRMLDAAGVRYTRLHTDIDSLTLDFIPEENR